jgi:hypothetical protein
MKQTQGKSGISVTLRVDENAAIVLPTESSVELNSIYGGDDE